MKNRDHYIFLGFAIPDEEMDIVFRNDKFPQIQTHIFNWNLIKSIEANKDFNISYISSRPLSDYPNYPDKKVKKRDWFLKSNGYDVKIKELSFYNTPLLKIATRFFSSFFGVISERNKSTKGIIVYSVHVPYMLSGYLLSKILKVNVIAVWTDPPSIPNQADSFLKRSFRGVELKLSKFLMKKVDKVIVLTKYLAEDFAPKKPYLVIEGIVDSENAKEILSLKDTRKSKNKELKIVYTGSISERYGMVNIIEAFKKLENSDIVLEVYGRGDYTEQLKEVEMEYPYIRYKGFKSNSEILLIQKEADFLINARAGEDEYVRYSFPSKTLEYMLSGTPLITTMLPGIPEEYSQFVIVLDNNKPETIRTCLSALRGMTEEDRYILGERAKEFALRKDYFNQGKKIIEFINNNEQI